MSTSPAQPDGVGIYIVNTGSANIAAVSAGLERLKAPDGTSARAILTTEAKDIMDAQCVVLPGVGSFGAVMNRLERLNLIDAIRERINNGQPTLCICLGLQILASKSEESPGVPGLGILKDEIVAIPARPGCRVPQMGWNRTEPTDACTILTSDEMYFANSFCLTREPEGWASASVEHGTRFIAAIERGPIVACQFHPELSGPSGLALMQRWLDRALGHNHAARHTMNGGVAC